MKIFRRSSFRNPEEDHSSFRNWVKRLSAHTMRNYGEKIVRTSIGKTHVWVIEAEAHSGKSLVIFPGARTTSLIWDLDCGLDEIGNDVDIYLIETNGLPNLSDGDTPDIRTDDYGKWAAEVISQLGLTRTCVAGASFGGLICMKLAITNPEMIIAAFLLNPGCLQKFSLSSKNLYYNILPIVSPTKKNVRKFLHKAILGKPTHQMSDEAEDLLIDYELLALKRYRDKTQKPYAMNDELSRVKVPTHLLLGDRDLLFPAHLSIKNARDRIKTLHDVRVYEHVGHGIETYHPALRHVGNTVRGIAW